MSNQNNLPNLRHSLAHLLASAVLEMFPKAQLGVGPVIENGFYYDFLLPRPVGPEDLKKLEKRMRALAKARLAFEKKEMGTTAAKKFFEELAQPFKVELIDDLEKFGTTRADEIFNADKTLAEPGKKIKGADTVTLYQTGKFVDLCRGGHVGDTSEIKTDAFQLDKVSGAYWRGDQNNPQMQRIYGLAFETKDQLEEFLRRRAEAEKRDHRKLGAQLDLFSTSPLTGAGLILWHPKLSITRDIVEKFWKKEHYEHGYQIVYTPHIASLDMFVISRHLSKYINSMFPVMLHEYIEGESAPDYQTDEVLKPMNCPNHIQIFKSRPRSYRELPLRMGELGTVYRYERAGVLHGMTRVRGFTQDDTHIFCTPRQVLEEVRGIIRLTKRIYSIFGFSDYQAYLSTRPEKYLGSVAMWDFAQKALIQVMEDEGVNYKIDEGEGVFYGPKIDSKIKDSLGREWQLGTIQFDFNQPDKAETTDEEIEEFWKLKTFQKKFQTKPALAKYLKRLGRGFDVNFINREGKEEHVVMIHRTILGSLERFFGILIEHFAGAFPVWLAPVQISLVPVSDKFNDYADKLAEKLRGRGLRVEVDIRSESVGKKIREAEMQKAPYMLVVGEKERASETLTVRQRGEKAQFTEGLDAFVKRLEKEIDQKK